MYIGAALYQIWIRLINCTALNVLTSDTLYCSMKRERHVCVRAAVWTQHSHFLLNEK